MSFLKENLFALVAQLQPNAQPAWGNMSPQHIVEHFIMALSISSGVIDIPVFATPEQVAKNYDYIFTKDNPLKKGLRLPFLGEQPEPYQFVNMEESVAELQDAVERFYDFFAENPDAKPNHPAFGALSFAEWEKFHEKHFRHHLAQFGL